MKKAETAKKKRSTLVDRIYQNIKLGDRVVWIVVLILILLSLVAIFSSTSLLAIKEKVSRTTLFLRQLKVVGAGTFLLLAISAIPNIKVFRIVSRFGFLASLFLLVLLDLHVNIGNLVVVKMVNGAYRSVKLCGVNIHVAEFVKVAMVMYLAWAVQTYETGKFKIAKQLARSYPGAFGWLESEKAQRWVFINVPILVAAGLMLPGGTSSALLGAIVMGATVMIGGLKFKDIAILVVTGILCVGAAVGLHIATEGKFIPRLATAISRMDRKDKTLDVGSLVPGTQAFYDYLDDHRQPDAAEIAFVEGGRHVFGKGPGKSTQKYVVSMMFEDYMFSFIVEEYGLIVGIIVILMYMSLFARGTIIVHNCNNRYAKSCVGGLVFLITFQALFHVLINCNIGVLTGQTLPMISHGRFSFLCFSVAFGVILSISKMANKKIHQQQLEEKKLMEKDEISLSMDIVDGIDDMLEANESNN